ncbi:FAD-dependent oxidoreductase [Legionella longbeachae]|uniref:Putative kynurenine 3-monooxygenase n=1 Tax=Legionella longbeachae serogroup 1 (strain NSW150) TaxID=661367 RepID=D3HLZ9_LEGLN|nr:NAD(P)/FAD-dependent oxidoreductase [Legionella longbeachae]VEE03911.1 kynurenine 3-monooxygenase [Legionella oakridgensis]HBD7397308.1 FAD-dependent monooxygenase [Legionella pneumophila]ARB93233.1 FAD-dependent monooxygenase [Legionella longbeachae]ARM33703.1 FAD-dependent monooxygenase [Legionella longbeachae]EEZ97144.1 kynurenine 3-monooxygenase [Legionella longbeachae D-4968]
MREVTIIGSGLAGTLLAIYLAKRGCKLEIFDSRPDIRSMKTDDGRSINLALSCRGITGLAGVGILPKVEKLMVPMHARAIHELNGEIKFQSFGRHQDEYINAIQRNELNKLLLNEAEKFPSVHFHFDTKLTELDVKRKVAIFELKNDTILKQSYSCLIGADGANSAVREQLKAKGVIKASRTYLPYGYKELSIGEPRQTHLIHEHLHLWPRDAFLLLGNPNLNQSITGSLFLPCEGKNSFAKLDSELKINTFFKKSFPDAFPEMPKLLEEFTRHPTGNMSTIKCDPWYYEDQCLLIGDAAHGVVPFFGQGMNSAFEDCRILNNLLDQYKDDWKKVMPAFYQARKVNTDAVAQMSMDNFHEIQTDIRDKRFNLKKQLEQELMHRYPTHYVSKHVLVMFTNTPYAEAQARGELQTQFLNSICDNVEKIEDINWSRVENELKQYDKKLTNMS